MRHVFTSMLIIGIVCCCAHSQPELAAGPKVGLALANAWGDGVRNVDTRIKPGFVGGGMIHVRFAEFIGAQAEAVYSMKGYRSEEDLGALAENITHTWNYLEFPLLGKLTVDLDIPVQPVALIGPTFGFLLNVRDRTRIEVRDPRIPDTETVDTDRDRYTGFEFGFAFGAGVEIGAGPGVVLADMRYTLGLTNALDSPDNSVRNGQFTLSAGYLFQF